MEGKTKRELPSAFQPDDKVGLQTLINLLQNARDANVVSVSFTESKVKYNLAVPVIVNGEEHGFFRMANIDSAFIHKPIENDFQYNDQVSVEARTQNDLAKNEIPIGIKQPPHDDNDIIIFDVLHDGNEYPYRLDVQGYSDSVLIDPDGTRNFFTIGWYDFDEQKWVNNDDHDLTNKDKLRWQYLPLNKYDNINR